MRHAWCAPLTPGLASGCSGLVAEVTDVAAPEPDAQGV